MCRTQVHCAVPIKILNYPLSIFFSGSAPADTAKYEYLHNGIAVGIVEICKDYKPGLLVHGKTLLDIQVKVQVIVNYNVNENDIQEFNEGAFLALSKVKR